MVGVFIAQFFNTGILLILVNANFSDSGLPSGFFNREYPDFTSAWYTDIGSALTQTMLINAILPFIMIFVAIGMKFGFRCLDRKFTLNTYNSKKKTVQQYVDLYSGSPYEIDSKYANILKVVFITLMYGSGLPLLYPIALLSFVIQYAVERYSLLYLHPKPPEFDDKLNKSALSIMSYGSLLAFGFGYWMLSNNQIFTNILFPLDK